MSMRDMIAKALTGIRAYHSSPHDFDKFDLSKVRTGEGGLMYGHGIYAAENPAVSGRGGEYWKSFMDRFPEAEQHAATRLRGANFDRDAALKAAADDLRYWRGKPGGLTLDPNDGYVEKMLRLRQAEHDLLASGKPVGPRTYEVNINARPDLFLDWDKGIARQSPQVQDALRGLMPNVDDFPFNSGDALYHHLSGAPVSRTPEAKARASAALNEAGIPGIRYLDAGSRAAPSAASTSNYVVFDPGMIDIVKKYGVVGTGLGMGAIAAQDQYGAQQ